MVDDLFLHGRTEAIVLLPDMLVASADLTIDDQVGKQVTSGSQRWQQSHEVHRNRNRRLHDDSGG